MVINSQVNKQPIEQDSNSSEHFRWLMGFVLPRRLALVGVALLSVVAMSLALLQPYFTKLLLDDGLLAGDFEALLFITIAMVVLSLVSSVLGAVNQHCYTKVSANILFALRDHVYRHLQRLSPSYYSSRPLGDVITRLNGDVAEIQRFATDGLLAAFNGVLALLGSLIIIVHLSPMLSVFAFILLPLQFMFLRKMRPIIERQTKVMRENTAHLSSFFVDTLSSMKFIQASNAQTREAEKLCYLNQHYLSDLLKLNILNYVTSGIPGLLVVINTSVIFILGGYLVIQGEMTVGTLMAFSLYLAKAVGPVQTLLGIYVASKRAKVSLDRVREIMDEDPAVKELDQPLQLLEPIMGSVELKAVSFSHRDRNEQTIDQLSLHIHAGEKVGVLGPSGIGKSTIVDLIHRHWDPQSGVIEIDGIDISLLSLTQLRRVVAVVSQSTTLFAGSIADNIRYAIPDSTQQTLESAAKAAHIHEWISALPMGYETSVGERGLALSGGQRQRLSIARALLQKPAILVLDEATNALDKATELNVLTDIDRLFSSCTRIVISHQKEPLKGCDKVFSLGDRPLRKVV